MTLKQPTTPFSERAPLRKLIVLIDHEVAEEASDDVNDELGLLLGLLSHPYITMLRYADEGPPAAARRKTTSLGESVHGWVTVGSRDDDALSHPVVASDGLTVFHSAIAGDHIRAAEHDVRTSAYSELPPEQAKVRRGADATAARAAFASNADLFITRRPYLKTVTWDLGSGVLITGPEDALPLVALYLRSQGVFLTYRSLDGTATSSMNRGLFYWVGTRSLLPAGWRWFSACLQHGVADDRLVYLAQSAFTRVQRALEARDLVHRSLNQPQDNDTAEIALSNLDVVLITLMGAVDVTARLAHRVLGLPEDDVFYAGWQRRRRRQVVARSDPALARLFADGTWHATIVKILSRLRNSVHSAAPSPLGILSAGAQRDATMMGFPHVDAEDLAGLMDAVGGRELWGMRSVIPGRHHADPGLLLEQLFPAAVKLIDNTMATCPVERLGGVTLMPSDCVPPDDDQFGAWTRNSILRQLGLGQAPPDTAARP